MKVLIFIVLSLTALAKAERDLSELKPTNVNPKLLLSLQPRIVGGKLALSSQFPHQVALRIDSKFVCGGSLIKPNIVLTAAHCVDKKKPVEIYAGVNNIKETENTLQIGKAQGADITVHEDWKPSTPNRGNDIAFIHLKKAFELKDEVQTVALYDGKSDLKDVQATVSGWGKLSDKDKDISDRLQYVTNKIISNTNCFNKLEIPIPEMIMCLSGEGNVGTCDGDFGGPLHISENNKLYQVGIASLVKKVDCQEGKPSTFTRVSEYSEWLKENLPK